MPRFRALLAFLLAVTWCSAAWHVDLEAAGLAGEHHHHHPTEHGHADHDVPTTPHDTHDPLAVREVLKDGQVRPEKAGLLWFVILGAVLTWVIGLRRRSDEREPIPIDGRTAPPHQRVWQFVQRCAPESAAPPSLA